LDALKLIEEKKPEIVLTDIRMKGMTGIEMIEELRNFEGLHFFIISGYSDFEYARSALRLGVTDYLLKPFKDEELEKVLEKVTGEIKEIRKNRLNRCWTFSMNIMRKKTRNKTAI
jgi:two-component system, response regulator YesN